MLREMELFFDSVIREDRSVMDLMTADYTFVNERLARHYGIPNVYGSHFRRVTLPQDERRGLLGKGAILLVTSLATRTSPVVRGKWILENIVGTPPPPPPPDVPASTRTGRAEAADRCASAWRRTARTPSCAQCHRMMDPIGFALEPFDAVGRGGRRRPARRSTPRASWRTACQVDGPVSLREALVERSEVFVTTMTEKLMIYALGRGLGAHDMPAVRGVVRAGAAQTNYRFSSLVAGIVKSVPFQMRVKSTDSLSHRVLSGLCSPLRRQSSMFITKKSLPRRTFLRGMGVTFALPLLDAMVPALSAQLSDGGRAADALRVHLRAARRDPRQLHAGDRGRQLRVQADHEAARAVPGPADRRQQSGSARPTAAPATSAPSGDVADRHAGKKTEAEDVRAGTTLDQMIARRSARTRCSPRSSWRPKI